MYSQLAGFIDGAASESRGSTLRQIWQKQYTKYDRKTHQNMIEKQTKYDSKFCWLKKMIIMDLPIATSIAMQ